MKRSYKLLLGAVAVAGTLCLVSVMYLQSRAGDFWGYGKLGLSEGAQSPVFFVEVRGVGERPTIACIVRCADHSTAPKKDMIEVSAQCHSTIRETGTA